MDRETGYREEPPDEPLCWCSDDTICDYCESLRVTPLDMPPINWADVPAPAAAPLALTPAKWAELRMFLVALTTDDCRQVGDMARAETLDKLRRAA
jgi:hypothetical protein